MINKQNRSKVFLIIIGILLAANIATVSFFLLKKDAPKREKRPDRKTIIANFLKTEIGFNAEQLQQYDSLSTRYTRGLKSTFDSLRGSKDKQFRELTAANFNDSAMNSIADRLAASQKNMELRMFNHVRNIRSLCTPAQQPKFDSLFAKVLYKRGGGEARKKTAVKK